MLAASLPPDVSLQLRDAPTNWRSLAASREVRSAALTVEQERSGKQDGPAIRFVCALVTAVESEVFGP